MEKYYYLNAHNEQQGPVPPDQLTAYGVTSNTKVWKSGMPQWQAAGEVAELAFLFEKKDQTVPPPPPPPHFSLNNRRKPDNLLVWSILATVLCCLPLGIVAIINSNKVDSLWSEGRYEEARKAADNAKMFCLISLGLGIVSGIIGFFAGFLNAM